MFKVPFLEKLSKLKIEKLESQKKGEKTLTVDQVECGSEHTVVLVTETSISYLGMFKT